ncbi:UPF0104 family protein [bacterium]|nr:MAG: UPF0104 family protein [bacterium]
MAKKIFSIFLRVGISIVLLVFLFRQVDEKVLFGIIRNANKPLLVAAFLIFGLIYLLCIWRWKMLLEAAQIKLPLKRIVISFAGGIFFNMFLPSTIGGDFVRSVDLAAHTKKPRQIVATVFLDRLSGYIGLVIVALLALLFGWKLLQDRSTLFSVILITALLIAILFFFFNSFVFSKVNKFFESPGSGKIKEAIGNLHEEIHHFKNHKRLIIDNLVLSFFIQIVSPVTFYTIALSLGIKINITYFFIFLPIIGAITLLPISIGGLGLRDAATIFFFAKAGVGKDLAFAMSLMSFLFLLLYAALGGLIYVLTVHHRRLQSDQPSAVCPRS